MAAKLLPANITHRVLGRNMSDGNNLVEESYMTGIKNI